MNRFSKTWTEPKRATPETLLKKAVKQYLALKGWKCWHNIQSLGSFPGVPDLTAVRRFPFPGPSDSLLSVANRTLWIECKSKNGKLSLFQQAFQKMIEDAGGEYLVVRDIQDLIDSGI